MPTYKGKYSPDYKEGDLGGDLNYMPGRSPNSYVKDAQSKTGIDLSGKIDKQYWDWRPGPLPKY